MEVKPDCYKCYHRCNIPGDAHIQCVNPDAEVEGNPTGIRKGWFFWPLNFDPVWLVSCDGFISKPVRKILDKYKTLNFKDPNLDLSDITDETMIILSSNNEDSDLFFKYGVAEGLIKSEDDGWDWIIKD